MRAIDRFVSQKRPDYAASIPQFPQLGEDFLSGNPQRRAEALRLFNSECAQWRERLIIGLEKLLITTIIPTP